ncbi:hypothetical protein [Streptomyces sp. ZAF1911]|uniref:hypothetical protein n=1 Tax=Streptomyces sp. ZAF1911 TaxID=2944129 RepID=UPI0030B851BC
MPESGPLARALDAPADLPLRLLPEVVAALLRELAAPPRLAAHLRLVHDVAYELTDWFARFRPELTFDREAVLFGAATHDIGKAVHTAELEGPGSAHEPAGGSCSSRTASLRNEPASPLPTAPGRAPR